MVSVIIYTSWEKRGRVDEIVGLMKPLEYELDYSVRFRGTTFNEIGPHKYEIYIDNIDESDMTLILMKFGNNISEYVVYGGGHDESNVKRAI